MGLHALLRDELHLHRPGGLGRLPRTSFQYRWRRSGDAGWFGRGAVLSLRSMATLVARDPRCLCWRGVVWRALGLDPGVSASQTRQPHRDHYHHVQLHRCSDFKLCAGGIAAPCGRDGSSLRQIPRSGAPANVPRHVLHRGQQAVPWRACQRDLLPCVAGLCLCLAAYVAHQAWVSDPRFWAFGVRCALCRHQPGAHHRDCHADLWCAGGHDVGQHHHGGERTSDPEQHRGRWLYRHRRGADGAQPSVWRAAGRDPVWLPLPRGR
mmetsp:Transcript_24331/g.45299  ORF Transcript_24331/g.45299 Transcript_24331/m.45299 type:complete len:265 (-) Transcript_24331:1170-1964(-)